MPDIELTGLTKRCSTVTAVTTSPLVFPPAAPAFWRHGKTIEALRELERDLEVSRYDMTGFSQPE